MTDTRKVDTQKTGLFENMPVPRAVAKLAVPTIISSLVMILYNMADTYFVGMLNDPVQNAAVALAGPVLLAFNAVNNLFGVGSSSMMSRALGRKDYETVYKSSAFGFYSALLCGILFSLLCTVFQEPLLVLLGADGETAAATAAYMRWTVSCGAAPAILNVVLAYMVRSEGNSFHASIGTMSGCLLNIVLDPVFILPQGLGMGAAGAALATFLSNCVACLYFFLLLLVKRRQTMISLNPRQLHLKKEVVLGVCVVGIPAAIQNLLNVTGMTILNNFTSGYGAGAMAAMGITQKIYMIPMYVALGLSQGIMPLISYNYGSGNSRRMKDVFFFSSRISLGISATVTLIYFFGAQGVVSLFMENPAIVAYGSRFLRGLCLAQPFLCIDFIAVGVFQSCGMGRRALLFAVLRKIILEIPLLVLLDKLFPPYGLAYSQLAAEFILAAAALVILARIFRSLEKKNSPLEGGGGA